MKGSSEIQWIDLDVYGHAIGVVFSDDVADAMYKAHPEHERMTDCRAATFKYTSKAKTELYFPFDASQGTLVHEVFHAVWNVFEYHGIKLDEENAAYHLGFIFNQVLTCRELAIKAKEEYARNKELEDAGVVCEVLPSESEPALLAGTA